MWTVKVEKVTMTGLNRDWVTVKFYKDDEEIELRCYPREDYVVMSNRIFNWVISGTLPTYGGEDIK
jgi:hypothetical protein